MVPLSVQGGGGRLRPCFPVSSFPSSRNPSPPFPNLEARLKLKFLLPALSSQRSIWASALIPHNSWGVPAPLSAHPQPALHHCPLQPLCGGHHRDAPKPSSSSHLQVSHTPLWQAKAAAGEQLESQPALQTSPCSRTMCSGPNPPSRFPNIRSAHTKFSAVPGHSSEENAVVGSAWTSSCCCFKSLRFKYMPGKHHNSIYSYS